MSPYEVISIRLASCRYALMGHAAGWPPSLMVTRAREVLSRIEPSTTHRARADAAMQAAALLLGALEAWEVNAAATPQDEGR